MLPMSAQTWSDGDLRRAVIHELEHVRRCDWLLRCIARAVCAFYWFHPLVWLAWRRFILEGERACDDAVLQHTEATTYADQLVVLAQDLSARKLSTMTAMAGGFRRTLFLIGTVPIEEEIGILLSPFEIYWIRIMNPEGVWV